jgi:hypothetical protein
MCRVARGAWAPKARRVWCVCECVWLWLVAGRTEGGGAEWGARCAVFWASPPDPRAPNAAQESAQGRLAVSSGYPGFQMFVVYQTVWLPKAQGCWAL